MAATGTPTPNIGLRIPLGTDPASVDDINYNSNLIDTKLGAIGNDSVQDQIDDLNSNINDKIRYHFSAFSPTLPSNVTGQGTNPTQYFYSSSVVSVKISFKITGVTQTGYPGRVVITHNIPSAYAPPYDIQFVGGNGEGDGITPGMINGTAITIYPMKTGTTYCQATITYIASVI